MKYLNIIYSLLILFILISCKDGNNTEIQDEYAEFKIKPDYLANPTKEQKAYFEAYDKTLEKWGIEYDELYVTTSKGIAHIVLTGPKNGVPLVLMHGMSASSSMWYPNAMALAKEYRLFAIDLIIEPGKSYKTADFKNLKEVTEGYQEILWALKLDSFHLVGASRGGWLAIDLALKSHRDIRSIILLSPAQTIAWIPPSTGLVKNILNVFSSQEKSVERTLETMSVDAHNLDASYREQYHLGIKSDSLSNMAVQMTPFSNKDLKSLKMPVLVLIGDEDIINPKRTIRLTEKHIPKGQGEIIENAGHFLSVEQADKVNLKMLNFLRNVEKNR